MTLAAVWAAITKLVPWWVRVAIIVALAAATWGAVKMHQHDERQIDDARVALETFQAQVAAAGEKAKADANARAAASDQLIADLEKRHAKNLANALAARDAEWMRNNPGRNRTSKPLPQSTRVCSNDAENRRLLDALQRYRDGLGTAVAEYRGRVRSLLQSCERDAASKGDALEEVHDWATGEQKIHSLDFDPLR